jgi:four helix bundle protein
MFKFEKLIIWQKAMDFAEDLNKMTEGFPKKETYNLSSQTMRAADSIALNISEGSIGQSNPEFKKFMGYAIRSLAEVVPAYIKLKGEIISHKKYSINITKMLLTL